MKSLSLHDDFGAQVEGTSVLDVASSEDAYLEVREAFEKYSVLVWRNQDINSDTQVAFTRAFGPLEVTRTGNNGVGTLLGTLKNIGLDGALLPEGHRDVLAHRANQLWHTDSSFKSRPALASSLRALVVAIEGGETEFVSTRAAWNRLQSHEQERLRPLTAVHSWGTSRSKVDSKLATAAELALFPPVRWRMMWKNPVNKQTSLYLASHLGAIEGMGNDEATALIEDLQSRATQPAMRYTHRWKPGDMILWDNRATMHRVLPWRLDVPRHMVRTTVSATERDGVDSVRPPPPRTASAI